MQPLFTTTPEALVGALEWRYATKVFDAERKIEKATWAALERALVLSPSSFGLQPYKFLIITGKPLREKLVAHAFGQRQVADCSHFVVFTGRTTMGEHQIDRLIQRISQVRGIPPESLKSYRDMMHGSLTRGPISKMVPEWAARQVYIAIGNLMTGAAMLGVDACPIEGFVPDKFDELLNLKGKGYTSVVCCALGYRAAGDKYAAMAKVRLPEDELIECIP
jgi:nitroreductase